MIKSIKITSEESLDALDRAFIKLGKKRVEEIIKEVKEMNIGGITLKEYLKLANDNSD